MFMGRVVKCVLVFNIAFWESDTTSDDDSEVLQLELLGPAANIFPAQVDGLPALVALVTGSQTVVDFRHLDSNKQCQALLQQLKAYFRCPELEILDNTTQIEPTNENGVALLHFVSKCWMDEPYSGGCFAALMPPCLATEHGDCIKTAIIEPSAAGEISGPKSVSSGLCKHSGIHFTCCELADRWCVEFFDFLMNVMCFG